MAVRREFVSLRGKDDVMSTASDRFERRLSEELGTLKVENAKEFAATRVSLLRWMFAFWASAILAILVK